MYLTTTISIMLVLLVVGSGCVLLLSADNLLRQVRQNIAVDVVLTAEPSEEESAAMETMFTDAPYVHQFRYISKAQALEDHIRLLGEDPTKFLGFNPLSASYEVNVCDAYANPDSLTAIATRLESLPNVDKVIYQERIVSVLDRYVNRVVLIVGIGALLMLLVAWALIMNMIRLQIYSHRFLINTMTLVGATAWHVKKPFVGRGILTGIVAAVFATMLLSLALYAVRVRWGIMLFPLTWQNAGLIIGVMFGTAIIITTIASLLATGRYIRMRTSTLYEI